MTIVRVMVDCPITGVENQLQQRMGMRVAQTRAHLHGEEEEENETQDPGKHQQPGNIPSSGSWSG